MSCSVNYNDLYEQFLQLTSSPPMYSSNEDQQLIQDLKQTDTPDNSPLRILTPPSPISTSYVFPATTFLSLRLETNAEQVVGMSSDDFKCDGGSEATTTPNSVAPNSSTGNQMPMENNSTSQSNGHSTYFQNPPSLSSSGTEEMQGALQQNLQHHHNNMIMDAHQQHHVSIHHPTTNPYANQHLQHQLMEGNHHQAHQMNLSQQPNNSSHQFPQMQPIPPAHIPHPNIHSNNSQALMPFGLSFNSNNMNGNGASYLNNQMGNFLHGNHNQFGNQQQAHQHSLQQHASCFMQHPCMQQPSLAALSASRLPSSTVGWMSSPTSTVPISNFAANNNSSTMPPVRSTRTKSSTSNISRSAPPDPTAMPGGLEHLWRNVPIDCQRIMTAQDVPDSARYRGYFTVCELLHLKRVLVMRLGCSGLPVPIKLTALTGNNAPVKKEKQGCKKGPKKKKKIKSSKSTQAITTVESLDEGNRNGQENENKQQDQQKVDDDDDTPSEQKEEEKNKEQEVKDMELEGSKFVAQMLSLNTVKSQAILMHPDMPPITGICVAQAVTDAMNALTSEGKNNASANPSRDDNDSNESEGETDTDDEEMDQVETADVEKNSKTNLESNNGLTQNSGSQCESGITGEELARLPPLPPISDILPKNQLPMENSSSEAIATTSANNENKEMTPEERHKQFLSLIPFTAVTTTPTLTTGTNTVQINTAALGNFYGPLDGRIAGPSTPFRTLSLVLKLLQIGSYSIRSFSSLNPNRLRVLFNTQRMTYECQLPIFQHVTSDVNPTRKVLTVDIGFEQISLLRFGEDTLFMRVEGAPQLTLSYAQALDEPTQALTASDQLLLEQIDKGQLKLSPCHQLYFLNERLVHQLESHFRDHPRFRQMLLEDEYNQQRIAQKRMRMS